MSFRPVTSLAERPRVLRSIARIVKPHVWESGFMDGAKPLRLYAPKKPIRIRGGFVVKEIQCVGVGWVSEDGYGGGLVTTAMRGYPLEDLIKIRAALLKHFKELPHGSETNNDRD